MKRRRGPRQAGSQEVPHVAFEFFEQKVAHEKQNVSEKRQYDQGLEIGRNAVEEDVLEGADEDVRRVQVQERLDGVGNDIGRVDDRRKPEPELDDDPDDFAQIAQEDRQSGEQEPEGVGEDLLHGEYGGHPQKGPCHRDSDEEKKYHKKDNGDGERECFRQDNVERKRRQGDGDFRDQVLLVVERRARARYGIREGRPRDHAGDQVDAVAVGRPDSWELRAHDAREDDRVNEDHDERQEESPQHAQNRAGVALRKVPAGEFEQEGETHRRKTPSHSDPVGPF